MVKKTTQEILNFLKFIEKSLAIEKKPDGEPLEIFQYGKVSPEIADIAEKAGMDVRGASRTITDGMIIHDREKHGLKKEDFSRIPSIADDPDFIYAGIKKGTQNPDHIASAKGFNGKTDIFIDRHFPSKNELRGATHYKRNKPLTKEEFMQAIKNTYGVDISKAVFRENKKAATDLPAGNVGNTPVKPAVAATSTYPSDRFSNLNITWLPPEVNRELNNHTKVHVRALYK